jgi:hypothetical protein
VSDPPRITSAERSIVPIRSRERVAKADLEVLKIAEASESELITSLVGWMGSRHG